jgi:hypothetical protein
MQRLCNRNWQHGLAKRGKRAARLFLLELEAVNEPLQLLQQPLKDRSQLAIGVHEVLTVLHDTAEKVSSGGKEGRGGKIRRSRFAEGQCTPRTDPNLH